MITEEIKNSVCYKYADDVLNNKIVACDLIKCACKRFMYDLEREDLLFKIEIGDKFIEFCSMLHLFEGGANAIGIPVNKALSDWQIFWIYNLLCFYRTNGKRRYTKCLVNIARKQAKTMVSALLGLWFLLFDGEGAPLICISANSKEQAMNDYKFCEAFAQQLDKNQKYIKQYKRELLTDFNKGRLAVFSSESKNADGYNPYCFIVDEMGGADSTDMVDVWRSGQGSRENPMGIIISSSGFDLSSPFKKMVDVGSEVLRGLKEDDSYFYLIFQFDEEDLENNKWMTDESCWKKVMPNLGISVQKDFVKEEINNSINNTQLQVSVKTKTFNIWCSTSSTWISNEYILKSMQTINFDDFDNKTMVWVGVDLASTSDLTAVSFLLSKKEEPDKLYFKTFYYLPEETVINSPNSFKYQYWQNTNQLIVTPGNVTDYDYIINDLMKVFKRFRIQSIQFDQWNSSFFQIKAEEQGLPMQPYSQSIASMNKPTKSLERLIKMGNVILDRNEVTAYCFENSTPKYDWNENIKIVKGGGKDQKIDGVVAIIMALAGFIENYNYSSSKISFI